MAAAFLLGELYAAGYVTTVIWGVLLSLLPMFIGGSLWKIKKTELLLIVLMFVAGVLLIRYVEEPKEAFGYVDESFAVVARGKIIATKNNTGYFSIVLRDAEIIYEGKQYSVGGVLLYVSDVFNLRVGDVIAVSGELSSFSLPHNFGEFNLYNYYKSQGIFYSITVTNTPVVIESGKMFEITELFYTFREHLTDELFEHCYSVKDAGTLSAILLGEKQYLDEQLEEHFRIGGISHVLVVSGLHISLIGMGIFKLLRKLIGHGPACVVSIILVIMYVALTGFGTSGQRALIMFGVSMLGNFLGKSYDLNSGIGFALLCMLINSPYLFLNSGFVLSFLSVYALGTILPMLEDVMKWAFHKKNSGAMAGIAVFWITLPVVVWNYYEYSLYSIILNLLIIPCMSMLVISGSVGLLGECLFSIGEILLKGPVHILLSYYENLCRFFNEISIGRVLFGRPSIKQMICVYTLLAIIIGIYFVIKQLLKRDMKFPKIFNNKRFRHSVAIFLLFGISVIEILILLWEDRDKLKITMLDVGQGECIFIEVPTGENILIDAGSADVRNLYERRLDLFFKANAVKRIDCIIISHADSDHCNALEDILCKESGISVDVLALPSINGNDSNIDELFRLGQDMGCKVEFLGKGDKYDIGKVHFFCLNPDEDNYYVDDGRNDNSIVLHMKYGDFDMLFTGDIGNGVEQEIEEMIQRVEVLKVAHHGSKYSNCEGLINKTMPLLALISCGKNNNYGHPHPETVKRLEDIGCRVMITPEFGAITIEVGKKMRVYGLKK